MVQSPLREWNNIVFGYTNTKLKALNKALGEIMSRKPSLDNRLKKQAIWCEIDEQQIHQEQIWHKKLRELWI